jgi:hypothetical protein
MVAENQAPLPDGRQALGTGQKVAENLLLNFSEWTQGSKVVVTEIVHNSQPL